MIRREINIDTIRNNQINLLDCQLDLILDSLSFYMHAYRYVYNRKECETEEENLKISLVRDTYCQIAEQFAISKKEQPIKIKKYKKDKKVA